MGLALSLLLPPPGLRAQDPPLPVRVAAAKKDLKERFQARRIVPIPDLAPLKKAYEENAAPPADLAASWRELEELHKAFVDFAQSFPLMSGTEVPSQVGRLADRLGIERGAGDKLVLRYQELQERVRFNKLLWADPSYSGLDQKPMDAAAWEKFLAEIPRLEEDAEREYEERNARLLEINELAKKGDFAAATAELDKVLFGMGQRRDLLENGFGTMVQKESLSLVQETYKLLPQQYRAQVAGNVGTIDRQLQEIASKKINVPMPKPGEEPTAPTSLETKFQLTFYAALSALPFTSQWAHERFFVTQMGEAIRLNPDVKSSTVLTRDPLNPEGPPRLGYEVVLKDGSKRYESVDGLVMATSPDAQTVVIQDEARGTFIKRVNGQDVISWSRDPKTEATRGVFYGMEFDAAKNDTLIMSQDGDKLYITNGLDDKGNPKVVRWFKASNREHGFPLPNDLGEVRYHVEDGKPRRDISFSPDIIKRIAAGEKIDFTGVEELPVGQEALASYMKLMAELKHFGGLFDAAIQDTTENRVDKHWNPQTRRNDRPVEVTQHNWIESVYIRDGQLNIVLGETYAIKGDPSSGKPTHDHRIVADFRDPQDLKAFMFANDTTWMWKFNSDLTRREGYRTNAEVQVNEGRVQFDHFETMEKRGSDWARTKYQAPEMKAWSNWDTLKAMGSGALEGLGKGVGYILSPLELVVNDILGLIHLGAGGLVTLFGSDNDFASFEQVHGYYTLRQAQIHDWLGKGMTDKDEIEDAYKVALHQFFNEKTRPKARGLFIAYLDGEIDKSRRKRWAELYQFHREDPISEMDRAYMAAGLFGYANLAALYFAQGKEDFKQGGWKNNIMGGLNYAAGGFVIAGKAYLEGFGLGLATAPLKTGVAIARTGLTAKEVQAAYRTAQAIEKGFKGLSLTEKELRAVNTLKNMGRAEMAVFMAPAAGQATVNIAGMIDGWIKGDPEKAWANFDGLFSTASGFGAMGIGLIQGRASAFAARRGEIKARSEAAPPEAPKPPEVSKPAEVARGETPTAPEGSGTTPQGTNTQGTNTQGTNTQGTNTQGTNTQGTNTAGTTTAKPKGTAQPQPPANTTTADNGLLDVPNVHKDTKSVTDSARVNDAARIINDVTKVDPKKDPNWQAKSDALAKAADLLKVKPGEGTLTEPQARARVEKLLKDAGFNNLEITALLEKGFDTRFVDIRTVRPSQMGVGYDQVRTMVDGIMKDYKIHKADPRNAKFYENMTPEQALAKYLKEVTYGEGSGGGIEAYITPDGEVMVTDSHHRGSALIEMLRDPALGLHTVAPDLLPQLKVNVKGDYTLARGGNADAAWLDFYLKIRREGKGQWTPEEVALFRRRLDDLREEARRHPEKKINPELQAFHEHFGALPKRFKDIPNDPMRSAMGNALFNMGLESGLYYDYFEFKVYEFLSKRGITLDKLISRAKARKKGYEVKKDAKTGREVPEGDPAVLWELRQELLTEWNLKEVFADIRLRDPARAQKAQEFIDVARRIHSAEGLLRGEVSDAVLDAFRKDRSKKVKDPKDLADLHATERLAADPSYAVPPELGARMKRWVDLLNESQGLKDSLKK